MVNTYPDLFWGYTVIWLLLAGYLASLGLRIRKVENSRESSNKDD